jgi:RNA polymerase sigma-70 factor (ECF subfamily)
MIVDPVKDGARSGNDRLFETLFETEIAYVCRTLRRLGIAESEIEDLAHEVFVTVYRRLDSYDASRPLRPWLFGIAFRVAAGFRRLMRHQWEVVGTETEAAASDRAIAQLEARDAVLHALDALSLEQRAVFIAHELDGQAIPDVAHVLEIPLNTAYSRLRAARAFFKEAVLQSHPLGADE